MHILIDESGTFGPASQSETLGCSADPRCGKGGDQVHEYHGKSRIQSAPGIAAPSREAYQAFAMSIRAN